MTRQRIETILDELRDVGPSMLSTVLGSIDRTQDEGLRFQLWESACAMVLGAVADAASSRLRDPARHYGPGLGLEALSSAAVLPEPVLTAGLKLDEADLKKAAVDRHGPADDVAAHRKNIATERKRARAYRLLLLAIGVPRSTSGKSLLARGLWMPTRTWPPPHGPVSPCTGHHDRQVVSDINGTGASHRVERFCLRGADQDRDQKAASSDALLLGLQAGKRRGRVLDGGHECRHATTAWWSRPASAKPGGG